MSLLLSSDEIVSFVLILLLLLTWLIYS
jgi:hypothetical protein